MGDPLTGAHVGDTERMEPTRPPARVQKNIPTLEESSPCSRRTRLGGARRTPGGLQAALRFLAGQSLLTAGTGLRPSLEILASRFQQVLSPPLRFFKNKTGPQPSSPKTWDSSPRNFLTQETAGPQRSLPSSSAEASPYLVSASSPAPGMEQSLERLGCCLMLGEVTLGLQPQKSVDILASAVRSVRWCEGERTVPVSAVTLDLSEEGCSRLEQKSAEQK
ncbi:hypothetical protein MJG53_017677 [Ovis ammon polii x Ovis aries]|uniref:Uncharacterized protein n=1 Tax=Ovis ammon polii x Ovis aries TaxID=2918886 RepID=A0ACB9U8V6_9CETA|nr:hypothetical protein MJG53_017677 [Ovis ammon polii x Ovis aries]